MKSHHLPSYEEETRGVGWIYSAPLEVEVGGVSINSSAESVPCRHCRPVHGNDEAHAVLAEEQQKKAIELRNMTNGGSSTKESLEAMGTDGASCNPAPAGGCCQGNGGFTCCQSDLAKEDKDVPAEQNQKSSGKENGKESSAGSKKGHTKTCSMPTWFETWERADTYAALAVVAAAASVFVAFRVYKNLN